MQPYCFHGEAVTKQNRNQNVFNTGNSHQILNYIQLNHQNSAENCDQTSGEQIHVNRLINFREITNKSIKEEEEDC